MEIKTEAGRALSESSFACGWSKDICTYALAAAVNALAVKEAVCIAAEAQILFPTGAASSGAYALEKTFCKVCQERGIEKQKAVIRRNPLFGLPVVQITAMGLDTGNRVMQGRELRGGPGDELVLVKWLGVEGMLRIADEKGDELRQRFAPVFIRQIQSWRKELFAGKELEIARRMGAVSIRQIAEGGIFAALWDLAKETDCGLDLDMKRMSVLQETIEVCEQYRLNPYQLTSAGSFLMAAADGKVLADALCENQLQASIIGRLTAGNDKIIHNGEDVRYLDRPAPDEIYKIFL